MSTTLPLLCLLMVAVSALTPCEPFGLRIFYGDVVSDPNSEGRLEIYFNTKQPCPNSYINLLSSYGFKKTLCSTKTVKTSSFASYYTAYIQTCSIFNNIPFDETFSYTAYGWDATSNLSPTPFKENWISVKLPDPRPRDREIRMVVLADWGTIEANINIMTPITNDLKRVMRERETSAIMIAGDVAYDLDSNNGTTYEKFLTLMQEVSTSTPIFLIPGNHERNTVDANLLFRESFKTYGVDKSLASGIYFGSLYLAPFDPYSIIYSKQEIISSLESLKAQLEKGKVSGRFIVPSSHYPLICSAQYTECYDGFVKLQDHFDAMLDHGVRLYIGAHTHSY